MSDFKNVMKGGWHPKGKEGGKESWRGDFKGINQVAGWMGKSKKPGEGQGSEHISRPLVSLKDPASFGPPPRNVNYHGGAALPNEITPHTNGLGAPLSQAELESANNRHVHGPTAEEIEEEKRLQGPPLPYRADRTGLQTSHLPPPPVHRNIASPPAQEDCQSMKPTPRPPPRLPARQNSIGITSPTSPPPPSYDAVAAQPQPTPTTNGGLNTSAISRLGNAGISVPAFGIGKNKMPSTTNTSNPWQTERSNNTPSPQPTPTAIPNALSELHNRFSRMSSNTSTPSVTAPTSPQPEPQTQAPSWQQSQSALRTASNFHRDPSSVSVADAQSAAQTAQSGARSANAFKEKHSDSIAAAGRRANAFDQKYKVKSRFENFLDKHAPLEESPQGQPNPPIPVMQPVQSPGGGVQSSATPELAASISRKPPPPPPPKKPHGLHGNVGGANAPPVPLGTKPTF